MAANVTISLKYCKGCALCVGVCPKKALRLAGRLSDSGIELIEFDPSAGCTACLMCTSMCPDAAITVEVEEDMKTPAMTGR